MELAVVGDGVVACEERQIRIKLQFEDSSILIAEQVRGGLARCWFLVRQVRSIADLISNIFVTFRLVHTCPHGISLRMEDFTLPPYESIGLLKDKDIVSVHRKNSAIDPADRQVKHAHSSSFDTLDKSGPLGVKTHALEEFERETGGYESECEEDACGTVNEGLVDKALETSSRKFKGKKRKRDKIERDDEQGLLKFQVVPYTGGWQGEKEKKKKSKKQRLTMQEDDKEELHQVGQTQECQKEKDKEKKSKKPGHTMHDKEELNHRTQECQKDEKDQHIESSKVKKKKKEDSRNRNVASPEEPSVEKQHALKSNLENTSNMSLSTRSFGEKVEDKEKKPVLQVEDGNAKKLSRSTLRKKAKRRWKREHGVSTTKTVKNEKVEDSSIETAARKNVAEQLFLTKPEDDGDAEEERLPRIIRPGHIRFGPSDEDEDTVYDTQHPLPSLGWSNGISKRKGQSWGQMKAKRGSKDLEDIEEVEICCAQAIEFETFPSLEGPPQNGDVIAYRILEITASRCPELSEYRVGKVVDLESQSGTLKLADFPKYPTRKRPDDVSFASLYDEEGFFETQISSLVDVRLVEGGARESCKVSPQIPLPTQVSTLDMKMDAPTPLLSDTKADNSNTSLNISTPTQANTSNTSLNISTPLLLDTPADVSNANSHSFTPLIPDTKADDCKNLSTMCDSLAHSDFLEISEALERKKMELAKKEGAVFNEATELENTKIGNGCCSGKRDASTRQAKGQAKGRSKGWHKTAGGLGLTMALLRAENVS